MNDSADDERRVAETYRRHLQEIEAHRNDFVSMTQSQFLAWAEANHDKLMAIASSYGVSAEHSQVAVAQYLEDVRSLPELGNFDDVNVHLILRRVLTEIEDAYRVLEIPTRGGVVFGSAPILGQEARQRPVLLAPGVSIVNVSLSFLPFCDLIARVMAQTLVSDPAQEAIINDPKEVRARLAANPQVVEQWNRIILFCAMYDLHPPKEDVALTAMETYAYISLLRAIEIFALAHEYGHHVLEHGLPRSTDSTPDPIADEVDADFLAQGVSKVIGLRDEPINEYAISGAGAVVVLGTLQLVLRAKRMLETGDDTLPASTSHPIFADRIALIGEVYANEPAEVRATFEERRAGFVEILEIVWAHLRPRLKSLHDSGVRPKSYVSPKPGWMPLSQKLIAKRDGLLTHT